jgi:hypothetical protein
MIKNFKEAGSIMDSKLPVRHRTGRSVVHFIIKLNLALLLKHPVSRAKQYYRLG